MLAYPVGGAAGERPVLAGWILILLAFLVPVLPLIPLLGYLVAVLAASERGDDAPPFLARPRHLLWRGLLATVVLAVYLAIPAIVLVVTVFGAVTVGGLRDAGFVATVTIYAGSTAVLTLSLAGLYLCPVGLGRLGAEGRLRAAFDGAALRSVGGHAAYFVAWVVGALVLGFAGLVATTALSITRLGPVVASLVLAYGSILAVHLWGRGLARTE